MVTKRDTPVPHVAPVARAAEAGSDDAPRYLMLGRPMLLAGVAGEELEIAPGMYRVDAGSDRSLVLLAEDGRSVAVTSEVLWHDLPLRVPVALSVPGDEDAHHLVLLVPGGFGLYATSGTRVRSHQPVHDALSPARLAGLLAKWRRAHRYASPVVDIWTDDIFKIKWGTIEPAATCSHVAPQTFPPGWQDCTVVTCDVPPKGSYGPLGPGTATGVAPFPPGSKVIRGPFPGYLVATTSVVVTASGNIAGRVVELLVTSHVATIGSPTILSMTWQDVYRAVPSADGPVTFPAVIVATGRVPSSPPPPGTTWEGTVQQRLSSSTGLGVPTEFELRVDGSPFAFRTCGFYASYAGGPPPYLKCS